MRKPGKHAGFTLIETMVTLGIVGILAAIAYPSYVEQMRNTRRADAEGALMGLAGAMERHFTLNNSYKGAAAGGGDTGVPAIFAASVPIDSTKATYNLSILSADDSSFQIQAAPTGVQASDRCGNLLLDQKLYRNVSQAAAGVSASDCWRK